MNTSSYIHEDMEVWSEALHATAVNILADMQILMIDYIGERIQYIQKSLYTVLGEETESFQCAGESESDSCAGESEYSFQTRSQPFRKWL